MRRGRFHGADICSAASRVRSLQSAKIFDTDRRVIGSPVFLIRKLARAQISLMDGHRLFASGSEKNVEVVSG